MRIRTGKLTEIRELQHENAGIKQALDESLRRIQELESKKEDNEVTKAELYIATKCVRDLEERKRNREQAYDTGMSASRKDSQDRMEIGEETQNDARSIAHRVLIEHGLEAMTKIEEPVMRLPLKSISSVIPGPPVDDMVALTDKSRREIELTSQIDVLVKARRGIREDIVRMAGDFCESAPGASGLPPRETRRGPRIVSDVQIIPPRTKGLPGKKDLCVSDNECVTPDRPSVGVSTGDDGMWQRVDRSAKHSRKRVRRSAKGQTMEKQLSQQQLMPQLQSLPRKKDQQRDTIGSDGQEDDSGLQKPAATVPHPPKGRRAPRTFVVCIKRNEDALPYAQLLRKARENIELEGMGNKDTRIRRAAHGAVLIEIPGEDKFEKADLLAVKLGEVLLEEATVTRPVVNGELYIRGLDDSVCAEEITDAIVNCGGCRTVDVRAGPITKMPNGLGSIWVRCPLAAAVRVAASGRLKVGWTSARVTLQRARPVQCYRCWRFGHVSGGCGSEVDRSRAYFRCGKEGHSAHECAAAPFCVVCSRDGLPDGHRMGSNACESAEAAKRNKHSVKPMARPGSYRRSRLTTPAAAGPDPGGRRIWGVLSESMI